MSEIFYFNDGTKRREVRIRKVGENFLAKVDDGKEEEIQAKILGQGQFQFTIENITYKVSISKENTKRFIHLEGMDYVLNIVKEDDDDSIDESDQSGDLTSPMPGQVIKVLVSVGDKVKKGDDLIIIEAMKMESRISSPIDGIIEKIYFKEGDQVDAQVPLMDIKPFED